MRLPTYVGIVLLVLLVGVTAYGFTQLSGEIAVHFDASGAPDGYMGVVPGLLVAPVLGVLLFGVFQYLPRIDPLGENYESFAGLFEALKLLLLGIMVYVQAMIVGWNMGYTYNPVLMVVPIVFAAYYLAARIMEQAERNWFVGIRTPWTLSSDAVWRQTHAAVAPMMKGAAILSLAALVWPERSVWLFAVPAFGIAAFSVVYSYWLYHQEESQTRS